MDEAMYMLTVDYDWRIYLRIETRFIDMEDLQVVLLDLTSSWMKAALDAMTEFVNRTFTISALGVSL